MDKAKTVSEKQAHPSRRKSPYAGQMIQMDACSMEWIPGQKWHLHVAFDDHSGALTGLAFMPQETLDGYYEILRQTLVSYGSPCMIYSDNRTVFQSAIKNKKNPEQLTQFTLACSRLGIDVKTTLVPQAKGKVERANGTLQDRLPKEVRRRGVHTIEEANLFLKEYIGVYNEHFALPIDLNKSAFGTQPTSEEISLTLARVSERKIQPGHVIKYHNHSYFPTKANGKRVLFLPRECMITEAFGHQLLASISGAASDQLLFPGQNPIQLTEGQINLQFLSVIINTNKNAPGSGSVISLFQFHACVPGFGHDIPQLSVGVVGGIKCQQSDLIQIRLAIFIQTGFITGDADDVSNQVSIICFCSQLAFQSHGKLGKYRCIYFFSPGNGPACMADFICHNIAGNDAHIITRGRLIHRAVADGELPGPLDVFVRLVRLRQAEDDLGAVVLPGPGCIHGIGTSIFIPSADDRYRQRQSPGCGRKRFSSHDLAHFKWNTLFRNASANRNTRPWTVPGIYARNGAR